MFIKKLIIGILSFYAFEVRRASLKEAHDPFTEQIERSYEDQKKREKKKEKTYDNSKWKKKRSFIDKSYKLRGSHSKDARYSNQRKLRRMYRNG